MIAADVIVISSPVYFYSVNGQIKPFINCTLPKYLEISNKEFYFIVTTAEHDKTCIKTTIECFRGFLDCLENPKEKGMICGLGAWQLGDIKKMPVLIEAYHYGLNV